MRNHLLQHPLLTRIPRCEQCGGLCGSNPANWPTDLPIGIARYLISTMRTCFVQRMVIQWEQIFQRPISADLRSAWEATTWPTWEAFLAGNLRNWEQNRCPACGATDVILRGCDEHTFDISDQARIELRTKVTQRTGIIGAGFRAFTPSGCHVCDQCRNEYRRSVDEVFASSHSPASRFCPLALLSGASLHRMDTGKMLEQWQTMRGSHVAAYRQRLLQSNSHSLSSDATQEGP